MLQSIPELLANLPTEVVIDILVRLPVKKLLCFRCVSKPFLALIDSPVFVKLHINHSIKARNNQNLIVRVTSFYNRHVATYSINVDTLDVAEEIDLPLKLGYGDRPAPTVVGSCNGLLLLSYEKYKGCDGIILVMWNPFTRKYRKLPTIQIESPNCILRYKTYGMGYDSIHDDYKVVGMPEWRNKVDKASFSEIQVYSLKSNSWRRIPNFSYDFQYIMFPYERYGVFCSGALHWLVSEKSSESRFVAAFDVATEEYQFVPVPNFIGECDIFFRVTVLEGSLCISYQRRESIDVWVMRNYGVGESWIKLFSLSLSIGRMSYGLFTLLALSKDGTKVLYVHNRDNDSLFWFDIEHNSEERIDVHGLPRKFSVKKVMQSLVSLGSESQTYGTSQHKEEPGITVYKRPRRTDSGATSDSWFSL